MSMTIASGGNSYIKKLQGEPCKKGCRQNITFDPSMKTPQGHWIPLNLDGTKHDCPNDPSSGNIIYSPPLASATIVPSQPNQANIPPKALQKDLNSTKLDMVMQGIAEIKAALADLKNCEQERQKKPVGSVKA